MNQHTDNRHANQSPGACLASGPRRHPKARHANHALKAIHIASLLTVAAGIHASAVAQPADCTDIEAHFPTRPVTLIIGYPPGGQTDQVGRIVANAYTARYSHPMVVDNRGGAAGMIGTAAAAKANPDGYTLYLGTVGTMTVQPFLYSNLSYSPPRDFTAVAFVTTAPVVFVARTDSPVTDMKGLVAEARAKETAIALPGIGTTPHMASALLETVEGIKLLNIQYRGNAPALQDLLGGQMSFMVDSVTTALPHIKSGALRALGVSSSQRSPVLPDVPSISEQIPAYPDVGAWWGIMAPAATPKAVVNKLNCQINHLLNDKAIQEKFTALGATPGAKSVSEFAEMVDREYKTWGKVVKEGNIKVE